MKTSFIVTTITGMALACASATAQNLLTNGNLDMTYPEVIIDNAPAGPGPEDFFLPKPQAWVNVGTRTLTGPFEDELSSEPWAGPAPTPVTTDGSGLPGPDGCNGGDCAGFFKAFSGNTANGPVTAHLYQDVPAIAGYQYTFTGWAGGEPNVLMAGAEFSLQFFAAGGVPLPGGFSSVDLLPTLTVPNGEPFNYKQYSVTAFAPAGTVFVRASASMIGGLSNPAGGGQAFVVDDFELIGVPEPSSALLGLTALCALGRLSRRW